MQRIAVRLNKEFTFEAAHNLVVYKGACERLHGHSYKLHVVVEGVPSEEDGLLIDFKNLKKLVNEVIIDKVDHQELNEVMSRDFDMHGNTTCENMIIAFWYALDHELSERFEGVKLAELKLWETATSHAILTREMVYND